MNIELKNFKPSASLSEETTAYTATIWVDGKRACTAKNSGHGAPDDYRPIEGRNYNDLATLMKQIADHHLPELLADTPIKGTEDNEWMKDCSNETIFSFVIGKLITKKLMTKTLKQRFRKNVLILEEDGSISLLEFKGKPKIEPIHIAVVEDQHPDAIIMNTMPLDKAVDIYMTAIDKHDRESREGESS